MREFIRTHPWRLEIVPAVAVFTAVGHVVYYYVSGIATLVSRTMVRTEPRWFQVDRITLFLTAFVIFCWSMSMSLNHSWVRCERRKRFNYILLPFQANIVMLCAGMTVVLRLLMDAVLHVVPHPQWWLVPTAMAIGLGVTSVLEWTRPHAPNGEPEPAPPGNPITSGGAFEYVEGSVDWSLTLGGPLMAVIWAVCAQTSVGGYIAAGVVAILCVLFGRGQVRLTDRMLRSSRGSMRQSVALSDVQSVQVVTHEMMQWRPKGVPRRQWHMMGSPYPCALEITTKQGHIYRFGMQRPKYVCGLIESIVGTSSDATDA